MDQPDREHPPEVPDACPHCGRRLSQWEQVLLSVDRALMCKTCWYRILLSARDQRRDKPPADTSSTPME